MTQSASISLTHLILSSHSHDKDLAHRTIPLRKVWLALTAHLLFLSESQVYTQVPNLSFSTYLQAQNHTAYLQWKKLNDGTQELTTQKYYTLTT